MLYWALKPWSKNFGEVVSLGLEETGPSGTVRFDPNGFIHRCVGVA